MKARTFYGLGLLVCIIMINIAAYQVGWRHGQKAGYEKGRDAAMAVGQIIIDRWKAEYRELSDSQNALETSCKALYSICSEALK